MLAKGKVKDVDYWMIEDRKEAIKKAFSLARSGDIIALTGKGAETVMVLDKGKKVAWSDTEAVKEVCMEIL